MFSCLWRLPITGHKTKWATPAKYVSFRAKGGNKYLKIFTVTRINFPWYRNDCVY